MRVELKDIECIHFCPRTQSCNKYHYKSCEEDYFHRNGGSPAPCFCTMIDENMIDLHDNFSPIGTVWVNIKYVAKCCKYYSTDPKDRLL